MNSSKESIKHCSIDGQNVIIPSFEDWKLLRSDPFIDREKVSFIDELPFWSTIEFVHSYPELMIGLGHPSAKMSYWMPYIFLHIESTIQRVHLETLTCDFCGWRGCSANPMLLSPYVGEGVAEEFQLMKVAEKYPICPCPSCTHSLPRHSIWVEY